jgi:hypothetical protein
LTGAHRVRTQLVWALACAVVVYAMFVATSSRGSATVSTTGPTAQTVSQRETVTTRPAAQRPSRAPRSAAQFQAMFDRLSGGWAGGDGAASLVLPDGRTLWVFGDTIIGRPADSGPGYAPGARMVRNSFVLQDGGLLRPVNGPGGGEVLPNRPSGAFSWPTAGIVDGGALVLFSSRMYGTGTGSFDFAQVGTDVAIVDVPRGGDPVVRTVMEVSASNGMTSPSWGQSLVRAGGWIYMYGTRTDPRPYRFGKELYVARSRPGQLADKSSWQYHDGHHFGSRADQARPLIGADGGVSTTLSVLVSPSGRATVVSKRDEFLGTDVRAWTAPTPAGPFRLAPKRLFAAPSGQTAGELVYLAEAHPQFQLPGGRTLVSVSRNNTDLRKVLADRLLFRPQFHAVTLPR